MITDFQCNRVYFSSLLQRVSPKTYASMVSALEKHCVEYRLLVNTNDVWCRDYMPFKLQQIHFVALIMTPIICKKRKNCLQHGQMETKFAMI